MLEMLKTEFWNSFCKWPKNCFKKNVKNQKIKYIQNLYKIGLSSQIEAQLSKPSYS
jgi:hypothetical protein